MKDSSLGILIRFFLMYLLAWFLTSDIGTTIIGIIIVYVIYNTIKLIYNDFYGDK